VRRIGWLCAVIAVIGGVLRAGPAQAQTIEAPQSCVVWTQGGVVECFGSVAALKAAEAALSPQRAAMASPQTSCDSDLELFSGANYTGSELDIWDNGYWVNLSSYGWADVAVSFSNGACQSYLATGTNGSGSWYPSSGPWVSVPNMGFFDYGVKSVYIV
jgi:hypothetical protein